MARVIAVLRSSLRRTGLRRERISVPAPLSRGFGWVAARTTDERLIVSLATLVSIWAYAWYSSRGLYGYGDALSRIMIARRVVVSRTPGIAQLGTTWLPLHPILMLPLIWNNTLFHDGFAGSFPSMVAYVISSLYIYRITRFLFSARGAAWVAATAFMLNPSVVYMQATAMSEVPMICAAVAAIYYMLVWAKSYYAGDLIKSAVAVFAGTSIRYDGWPLAVAFAVVVVYLAWRRQGYEGAQAWGFVYGLLAFSGCAAWVIYNQVIFHDPLLFVYFGNTSNTLDLASNPSYHNAWLSLEMYGYASGAMVGWVITALAAVGLIVFVARYRLQTSMLPVYALLIPFVYYWLTFFLGWDSILLPQLGFGTYGNARFGLQMVPAMAFFVGYLATWWRPLVAVLLVVVVWFAVTNSIGQIPFALQESLGTSHRSNSIGQGPFALQEPLGTSHGSPSKGQVEWFVSNYHGGNLLISYVPGAPMMFFMMQHIPDDDFITDANGGQYRHALVYPQLSVQWIIMDENNSANPIWVALHKSKVFHQYFVLRKVLGSTMFYERIAEWGPGVGGEPRTTTSASAPAHAGVGREPAETLTTVLFSPGQDQVGAAALPEMRQLVQLLTVTHPHATASIKGYTDNTPSPGGNIRLSRQRALAVEDWLIAHGVAATRLHAFGYGDSDPAAPNVSIHGVS